VFSIRIIFELFNDIVPEACDKYDIAAGLR